MRQHGASHCVVVVFSLTLLMLAVSVTGSIMEKRTSSKVYHYWAKNGRGQVYYDAQKDELDQMHYYEGLHNATSVSIANLTHLVQRTHVHQFSYNEARLTYLYPIVDRHIDGTLVGVYTNETLDGPGGAGSNEAKYNTEHTIPQSWFKKNLPMRGDLHHLFTAQPKCNSIRSNYPHGICGSVKKVWQGCGTLYTGCFYPEHNRGVVARAALYFLIRYPLVISIRDLPKESLEQLVQWAKVSNRLDLSLWELHRNSQIYQVQGNRNPFIDHPEWIDTIDFSVLLKN
jgi:hypothetical protein